MSNVGSVTVKSQAASAPIQTNGITNNVGQYLTAPFNIGLACTVSAGASLTYSVQITCDPYPLSSSSNWINHDVLVNETASAFGNIAYAVTGVRLNVTSYSSGNVNLGVAQWP
jgi:hypothetical protein